MLLIAAKIFIGIIALLHFYILWFEMFAWTTKGPKIFASFDKSLFKPTKAMAANQGLYNGFLAAGLIWALLIGDSTWAKNVAMFFLACVWVAGVYGAMTADKKILFVQTVPASIALALLFLT